MPNELDGEEGLFVGYYEHLYSPSNKEEILPYIDCYTNNNINKDKIKKVINKYYNNLKKMSNNQLSFINGLD
jgi:hypothetical protein